jgi:hypothetical protein
LHSADQSLLPPLLLLLLALLALLLPRQSAAASWRQRSSCSTSLRQDLEVTQLLTTS